MEHILIVTSSKKSSDMLMELINAGGRRPERYLIAGSCGEARRILIENNVDLIVINAPLGDEFGHEFACHACESTTAGVVMIVKAELTDSVAERVESSGVAVISKPIARQIFYQTIHLVNASRMRIFELQKENRKLRQRLEDIRVIDRAKCVLIEVEHMSEPQAHAYIEKRAMNKRMSKRETAEEILNSF